VHFYLFLNDIFIILLLYWECIVTFTKVLTIYHSWIHFLHLTPLPRPHSYFIFPFAYVVFPLYSPSYTLPKLIINCYFLIESMAYIRVTLSCSSPGLNKHSMACVPLPQKYTALCKITIATLPLSPWQPLIFTFLYTCSRMSHRWNFLVCNLLRSFPTVITVYWDFFLFFMRW
jgi:hypothetical protein